jgi:hypothetical protein
MSISLPPNSPDVLRQAIRLPAGIPVLGEAQLLHDLRAAGEGLDVAALLQPCE